SSLYFRIVSSALKRSKKKKLKRKKKTSAHKSLYRDKIHGPWTSKEAALKTTNKQYQRSALASASSLATPNNKARLGTDATQFLQTSFHIAHTQKKKKQELQSAKNWQTLRLE
ncbi:unnamed protein product, partial [Ixodes persulcatus]